MPNQCLGTNRDGNPCSAMPDPGTTWCRWHDPDRESDRAEWRRKGGANRSNRARARKQLAGQVMSMSDMDAFLCASMVKVAAGRMEPGVGSAVATLARTIVAIRTAGEIERRLEHLEQVAGIGTVRRFS